MRTMSPMDAFRWFDTPVVSAINIPGNTTQQIVFAEARRVVLIISSFGGGTTQITIAPGDQSNAANGFPISSAIPAYVFNHHDHGILTQCEWYANNNLVSTFDVHIAEVKLSGWPEQEDEQVVVVEGLQDVVNRLSKLLKALTGNGNNPQAESAVSHSRNFELGNTRFKSPS